VNFGGDPRSAYHFWPGMTGFDAWRVDRLIDLSREFPVEDVELESIRDVDSINGFEGQDAVPPVKSIGDHLRMIQEADPSVPVILAPDGRVMDGMHRIVRATVEGRTTIKAVRFTTLPPPDFTDCDPQQLPI
jgi:hypothetical protein